MYNLIYFLIYKKTLSSNFVNKKIFITGYPRSGTTFLTKCIVNILHSSDVVSHIHNTNAIRIAIKKNIPTLITLRNPKECYTSSVIKLGRNSFRKRIQLIRIHKWYKYIHQNQKKLVIISFDKLIKNPEIELDKIFKSIGIKIEKDMINRAIKLANYTTFEIDKRNPLISTYPNKAKDEIKEKIFKDIENNSTFLKTIDLWEKILKS